MPETPSVILSGFSDEAANQKTAVQQFAAFAALGLQFYSIRFIDVGSGIKNAMQLTRAEIGKVRHLQDEYGLNVSSVGSPIGKVKLLDKADGSKNRYVPFKKYLAQDVQKACHLAQALETKLIRGFSFYHPKGTDPREHLPQAVDQLGQIAETCHRHDLTFGLEVEANLVGQNGTLLAEMHRLVNHPALVLVFDAANILTQGYSPAETFEQYQADETGPGLDAYQGLPRIATHGAASSCRRGGVETFCSGGPWRQRPRVDPAGFPRVGSHVDPQTAQARDPRRILGPGTARQRGGPVRRLQRS